MNCNKCGTPTNIGAKFCSTCGAAVPDLEVPIGTINLAWLAEAFARTGFTVTMKPDHFVAVGAAYSLAVAYFPQAALVTLEMIWNVTGAGMTNRRAFVDAVNRANAHAHAVKFQYSDDLRKLVVSMAITLFPSVSVRHLRGLVDLFQPAAQQAATQADLLRFA